MTPVLRDATWLTRERARLWGLCFIAAWICFVAVDFYLHTRSGFTDTAGEPFAHDFINYWAGAKTAVAGKPALSYDIKQFHAFENALAGHDTTPRMYSYPPVAMLLSLPLAFVSFWTALLVWTVAGLASAGSALPRGKGFSFYAITLFAAPAGFLNIASGQNGHFTAALLAGGLLLVERKPIIAGVLLGLLCYKPQLGLLLPVALLAGKHWRCFFAASATVATLTAISLFAFGPETWQGFIAQMGVQGEVMEGAGPMWSRFPTVFGAAGILGANLKISYIAQIISSLAAAIVVARVWRGKASTEIKAAVMVMAAFLATPYAWDYDMVILAFAAWWVAEDTASRPYQSWERLTWLGVICLPLLMAPLSAYAHLPLAPVILWGALFLTQRRADFR